MRLSAQLYRIALAGTLALLHEAAFASPTPDLKPPWSLSNHPIENAAPPGRDPGPAPCGAVALSALANQIGSATELGVPRAAVRTRGG